MVGYGYDFGYTPDAEFLIEWGCALVAGPAQLIQVMYNNLETSAPLETRLWDDTPGPGREYTVRRRDRVNHLLLDI